MLTVTPNRYRKMPSPQHYLVVVVRCDAIHIYDIRVMHTHELRQSYLVQFREHLVQRPHVDGQDRLLPVNGMPLRIMIGSGLYVGVIQRIESCPYPVLETEVITMQ